ncbi:MAG: hypothetical protein EZS28_002148 [Streblomastix strix]|uniref:RRM domain-containing protein n=1 Tax=Streblomastix strix TaxID=222440 RepID=A0A5J4X508_9EUKA|nr:MAG: hypothetical protein EZS28_002148 [Streblomastix strix]
MSDRHLPFDQQNSQNNGVYVSNFPRGATEQDIQKAFAKYGTVTEVSIIRRQAKLKSFAFLRFSTVDETYASMDEKNPPFMFDPVTRKNVQLEVTFADSKNSLFIVNIPLKLDTHAAQDVFERLSQIKMENFVLSTDFEGRSRGYGWATYQSHSISVFAMKALQGQVLDGLQLSVCFARRRQFDPRELEKVRSLFVKGIPLGWTPIQLRSEVLSILPPDQQQQLRTVVIPNDVRTKQQMGHAFIHFETKESAQIAMEVAVTAV